MFLSDINTRILVRNVPECFDFYTGVLGFVPTWGDRNSTYVSLAAPGMEGSRLALFQYSEMPAYKGFVCKQRPKESDHAVLCIPSTDIDEDYARLLAAGVTFIGEPQTLQQWYMRCVYFRDPEGNLLEIYQGL